MNLKESLASKLQQTCLECLGRGLFQSANWAAEQLRGLLDDFGSCLNVDGKRIGFSYGEVNLPEVPFALQSIALITCGQYMRSAHSLQHIAMLTSCSNLVLFLYVYSKYLAGEKRLSQMKDEAHSRLQKRSKSKGRKVELGFELNKPARNPYIDELFNLLKPKYEQQQLDGYLLYLFALVARYSCIEENSVNPMRVFMQSLATIPWNWSCWLDFSTFISENRSKIPTWEDISSSILSQTPIDKQGGRIMFTFFMAHIYLNKHRGDLSLQAMEKLHRVFPTSLYVLTQVGVGYYSQRLYDQAEECFQAIRSRDPFLLLHVDTFSNILYVKENVAALSSLAHEVLQVEKFSPEVCCVVGNYYSLKSNHERAVLYFQRALRIDASCLSAWTLMGHEFMELRNTSAAVQCYRNAIRVSETDYRAWYGLGQTYEMLHLYQYAAYYFKKAAFLRPSDARMWSAVGNCLLKLGLRADAIATYERAVAAGDREGVATRDLARLYRDDGNGKKSAELYYKYLQCNLYFKFANDSHSGRSLPLNLADLIKEFEEWEFLLEKNEDVDIPLDSEQAEAVLFLAAFLRNEQQLIAEYFCTRLLGFTGPEGDEARMMLKEIRSEQQLNPNKTLNPVTSNESRVLTASSAVSVSPLFSPWKRLSHDGGKNVTSESHSTEVDFMNDN